jgi:hypothetical protein
MAFWDREPFHGIIDEGRFSFTDTGPLHSPIKSFTLRRTEKLQLRLETLCGREAVANELLRDGNPYDDGNQRAEIKSIGGTTVRLTGVIRRLGIPTRTTRKTSVNCARQRLSPVLRLNSQGRKLRPLRSIGWKI